MAARIQQKVTALGKAKQSAIGTIGASFLTFTQLNAEVSSPNPTNEDDAPEIGKGHEFAANLFPVSYGPQGRLEKYGSVEFCTWAWAYALGGVAEVAGVYTLTPIDPGTTLELPYFTVVERIAEGGGQSVDNAFLGCSLEEVMNELTYGPGRASHKCTAQWVGSGKLTTPSGVAPPTVLAENNMLSASAAITINGTNYVSNKNILSCRWGWKNNLMLAQGFFPGSGLQNGYQIRGRQEIGVRVPTFEFRARLVNGSPEQTALTNLTTGVATIALQKDTNNKVTWTFEKIGYKVVELGQADGLSDVMVTAVPMYDSTNGVISVSATCTTSGIAQ